MPRTLRRRKRYAPGLPDGGIAMYNPCQPGFPTSKHVFREGLYLQRAHGMYQGKGSLRVSGLSGAIPLNMQAYRDVRNCLVHKYREDVGKRLTYGEAFKQLGGDAELLVEVWGLLDDWGIINFLAPADFGPPPPGQTETVAGDGSGSGRVLAPVLGLPISVSVAVVLSGGGIATRMNRMKLWQEGFDKCAVGRRI